jgi:hypothetical protein
MEGKHEEAKPMPEGTSLEPERAHALGITHCSENETKCIEHNLCVCKNGKFVSTGRSC